VEMSLWKRLWVFIRGVARALTQAFFGKEPEEAADRVSAEGNKKQKELPQYRYIRTSQGGSNAPKKQPCPSCYGLKFVKRFGKTVVEGAFLAIYKCRKCKVDFAVRVR